MREFNGVNHGLVSLYKAYRFGLPASASPSLDHVSQLASTCSIYGTEHDVSFGHER